MPGDTVVPAIATRTGWKTSRGFARALDHAAQRGLHALGVQRLGPLGERLARRGEPLAAPRRAITLPRAFSSAGPSKRKPASGQKSASVCIFSCAIATASASPLAAGQLLEPARSARRAASSRR